MHRLFFAQSNQRTIDAFNPRHIFWPWMLTSARRLFLRDKRVRYDDQVHFNQFIGRRLLVAPLDRDLFPNGAYYFARPEVAKSSYLIHFNYISGAAKIARMKADGYYYLN